MNDIKQKIKEANWYCVSATGIAHFCLDAADAKTAAADSDITWSRHAPHTATQLVPMALVDQLVSKMEGEANVMQAILHEAMQVFSTIEPEGDDEAQALGELRRKISQLFAPVESTLL